MTYVSAYTQPPDKEDFSRGEIDNFWSCPAISSDKEDDIVVDLSLLPPETTHLRFSKE